MSAKDLGFANKFYFIKYQALLSFFLGSKLYIFVCPFVMAPITHWITWFSFFLTFLFHACTLRIKTWRLQWSGEPRRFLHSILSDQRGSRCQVWHFTKCSDNWMEVWNFPAFFFMTKWFMPSIVYFRLQDYTK